MCPGVRSRASCSHTAWILQALAFVGAACDATGVLPGVSAPSATPMNNLYGVMYIAFLMSAVCPLIGALLTTKGLVATLVTLATQFVSGSPFYFVFQSRCIGYYYSTEYAMGGASYVATGRSIAVERQAFAKLYAGFATSCLYPGLELALLLIGTPLIHPQTAFIPTAFVFAGQYAVALLWAPALFNPRIFTLRSLLKDDLGGFLKWLCDPAGTRAWRALEPSQGAWRACTSSMTLPAPPSLCHSLFTWPGIPICAPRPYPRRLGEASCRAWEEEAWLTALRHLLALERASALPAAGADQPCGHETHRLGTQAYDHSGAASASHDARCGDPRTSRCLRCAMSRTGEATKSRQRSRRRR